MSVSLSLSLYKFSDCYLFHTVFVVCFSIMGEGENHGVVPQFAKELFERVEGTTDDEVGLSMPSFS